MDEQEGQINLTSLLDVVFNILAYFIITYSPPMQERRFDALLPPPKAVESANENPLTDSEPAQLFRDVTVGLEADGRGNLARIRLDQKVITGGMLKLSAEIRQMVQQLAGNDKDALDTALIAASPNLKYTHIVAAIDACHNAGIKKINFADMKQAPAKE